MTKPAPAPRRAITYCIVPAELAARLHDPLRKHFSDDHSVEVIVEQRGTEQRRGADRRARALERRVERRKIRNVTGRRIADRRVTSLAVDPPAELPRRIKPFVGQLMFAERLEPSTQDAEDLDTAHLVVRFQAGDQDAFTDLYMRYFDRAYAYLRIALKDPHEAEDATQQVFMKVLEALPSYERRSQPFRAWLFTVIRNYSLDTIKRLRRMEAHDPFELGRQIADDADAETPVLQWITDRELVMFVERLPAAQREVLVLRYMFDLSTREIAELLGRKPDDIRVLHSRAVIFLRERLIATGRVPARGRGDVLMRSRFKQHGVLRARRWALIR
jgi:RNA polymerase sigma-70 factor (ECF subfamily)